jgi:pilus assembly protein Flp/PilA
MAHSLLTIRSWLAARVESDRGASLVEYALLVALIAVICAVAIGVLGGTVNDSYSSTASGLG